MSFQFKFLRRVRIHGGECGAVARALHHKARFTLPAVMEKVSVTTYERKQMSIKTSFKRIAFAVVVTLSLGMLGTAPTNAGTIIGETMTVAGSSSTASNSIAQGETATVSVVNTFTPEVVNDSIVVMTSCAAPAGASCYNMLDFFWTSTTDSTTNAIGGVFDGSGTSFVQNTDDSFTVASSVAGQAVRFTSSLKFRAAADATAGVYTVTVYTKRSNAGAAAAVNSASPSITWTVTVTAQNTTFSALNIYITPSLAQSGYWANTMATSKDSAVVASNGKNPLTGIVTNAAVAYINVNAKNALGETTTVAGTNICATPCEITATVTNGPGVLYLSNGTAVAGVKTLATFRTDNSVTGAANETLVVASDGTAGTATITFYNGTTSVGTASVTFTGTPASATSVSLSDTSVAISSSSVAGLVSAVIKDSAGNALPTGSTVYVFASDTKVVSAGANSTTAAQYTQLAAGVTGPTAGACTGGTVVGGRYSCALTISDTGTSTIVFRDSWTVAASTWVSDAVTVTGLGIEASSVAVAFDKASYQAGELAIITITVKDRAGNAEASTTGFTEVNSSMSLGNTLGTSTQGAISAVATTRGNYAPRGAESGVETRVVYMPGTSGTVTFNIKYTPSTVLDDVLTTATASAVVTNPAQEAAEAANDAAAEAIDAANAATDAANLAAEAADAATVAAEEARDAADAATAAVEELATAVATLMAALKAQVTTLANTVAKIAKKVGVKK